MITDALRAGDRVWFWHDDGMTGTQVRVTVVRVNRKSVTVRSERTGRVWRIEPDMLDGRVNPDDE